MSWFDGLLWPIMVVVAWIMVRFHELLTWLGLEEAGGLSWTLAIVGLVIVIRILLIPLFFKQIRASRGMQMLAPEMQAIQKKYKGKTDPASREAMSRETMALYKKHGTNPFSSCLPILLQSPIFFALFRVLYSLPKLSEGVYPNAENPKLHIGPLTAQIADQIEHATIFGAPLSGSFLQADAISNTKVVSVVLIVAMCLTQFLTQRQLTMKNMPPSALEGPMAQQQKMLMYAMPLIFAFSGVNFPIGVLIYWTTTNLWSMGQQFYTIRRMPAPGSQAELAFKERKARKAAAKGITIEEEKPAAIEEKPRGQRQQPKRKDRAKPVTTSTDSGSAPKTTGTSSSPKTAPPAGPSASRPKPPAKKKPTK
ncbi:membrane protein insertase YidC [Cellulomonas sp. P22]|uniref:membrane protein insertase YidC n=1 Tax=Cellulomonas sp. P22 TaxID=3373189 RepID=UPI0037886669